MRGSGTWVWRDDDDDDAAAAAAADDDDGDGDDDDDDDEEEEDERVSSGTPPYLASSSWERGASNSSLPPAWSRYSMAACILFRATIRARVAWW